MSPRDSGLGLVRAGRPLVRHGPGVGRGRALVGVAGRGLLRLGVDAPAGLQVAVRVWLWGYGWPVCGSVATWQALGTQGHLPNSREA